MIKIGDWVNANILINSWSDKRREVEALVIENKLTGMLLILIPKGNYSIGWTQERFNIFHKSNLSKYLMHQFDCYSALLSNVEEKHGSR